MSSVEAVVGRMAVDLCAECPPPPPWDLGPPPDPSAFFAERGLAWDAGLLPDCPVIDGLGGWGRAEEGLGPYMGFLVAAIAVLVLFALSVTLAVLLLRRRRERRAAKRASPSTYSSSSPVLSTAAQLKVPLKGGPLKPSQWSYDAVRQPRSNFQVLMCGDGSRFGTESFPSLHRQGDPRQSGRGDPRQDPLAFATQGRPQRRPHMGIHSLHSQHSIPNMHGLPPPQGPAKEGHYAAQPVYEEILLQPMGDASAVVRGSSLDQLLVEERRRRPPPSVRPPPPPVMVDAGAGSPLASTSSASCSCSHTSNSLDQDMEVGIRVTPSPHRHGRTGGQDSLEGSGGGGSPKDLSELSRAPEGRESGYGTQRRPRQRHHHSHGPAPPSMTSMTYV